MKKTLLICSAILYTSLSIAQCGLTITTPTDSVDCGDCFTLTATGDEFAPVLTEDFNGPLGVGWNSNVTIMSTNPCGPPPDGSAAAWFGLGSQPRELTTIGYDVTCGGQVCFDMKYATQGGAGNCEGPDLANEGVHFQYSINNGTTWVDIQYWPPLGGTNASLTQWQNYCVTIPPVAMTSNTRFRWWQAIGSSALNDHWGLDNAVIDRIPCGTFYFDWLGNGSTTPGTNPGGTGGGTGQMNTSDTTLCLTSAQETYTIIYTNGISDTCEASITIYQNSTLDVNLGLDSILNCDQNTMDLVANETGGSGAYDIIWSTGNTNVGNVNNMPAGQYWVQVTDVNDPLCIVSDTLLVTEPSGPTANFTYTSVCEEDGIVFTDSSVAGDGNIISNEWDLDGDGAIDFTTTTVNTVFNDDGTYDVIYIVTDDKDCSDTLVEPVEIYPNPIVNFLPAPLCQGAITNFENLTDLPLGTNVNSWSWNFNNQGATSTDENPSHLFSGVGTYNIKLSVVTEDGCTGDTTITIFIAPSPYSDFDFTSACEGEETEFTNQSVGNFENSQWVFTSDTDTIFTTDATFTFPGSGNYDVTLIIEDANGDCVSTSTQTIPVNPSPDLTFTADPMFGEPALNVNFFSDPSGLVDNFWDFNDGNSTAELNDTIFNSFLEAGVYNVIHTGTSVDGCTNTYSLEIIVEYPEVLYDIPNVFTPNNDGINDGFFINYLAAYETITDFEIVILNRWGATIRRYSEANFIWDGKSKSGTVVGDGTYFYKVNFKTVKGKNYEEHGFVQVVND